MTDHELTELLSKYIKARPYQWDEYDKQVRRWLEEKANQLQDDHNSGKDFMVRERLGLSPAPEKCDQCANPNQKGVHSCVHNPEKDWFPCGCYHPTEKECSIHKPQAEEKCMCEGDKWNADWAFCPKCGKDMRPKEKSTRELLAEKLKLCMAKRFVNYKDFGFCEVVPLEVELADEAIKFLGESHAK